MRAEIHHVECAIRPYDDICGRECCALCSDVEDCIDRCTVADNLIEDQDAFIRCEHFILVL